MSEPFESSEELSVRVVEEIDTAIAKLQKRIEALERFKAVFLAKNSNFEVLKDGTIKYC